MDFANRFDCHAVPGQAATVDPFLNGDMRFCFELQVALAGIAAVVILQRAFNVAKHIRSSTNIQRGSISVGSVAVDLAEKIFESLGEREVMIIGAGDTGVLRRDLTIGSSEIGARALEGGRRLVFRLLPRS